MNDEQAAIDPQQTLDRPARQQVPGPVTDERSQHDGDINIWSGRRMGPRGDRLSRSERSRQASKYRCCPKIDTGRTKGSQGGSNTFCRYFAKGLCYQGSECAFLHRLPTAADNAALARSTGSDIFGREKLPDAWDNRRGAGSYERDMTTLYVHYGGAGHYAVLQLRHLLLENFGEFGPVKGIHIVPTKTIAFVRFHWRASAEFAREAMDQQQLTGSTLNEVLSVKWANDDPNPAAIIGRKRSALDAAESAAMAVWEAMDPEEKAARIAMAQQARAARVSAVATTLPQPLADDSFAAWRGFGGTPQEQQQQGQQGHGEEHGQQQQGQQAHGQEAGATAAAAGGDADPQEVAAQWQAYYEQCAVYHEQQQQQQQQQEEAGLRGGGAAGAWYKGWRQRQTPDAGVAGVAAAAVRAGAPAAVAAAPAGGSGADAVDSGGGGLGLLAGYGSDSDDDDGSGEPAAVTDADAAAVVSQCPKGQHEQQQQQQQPQQQSQREQV